MEGWITLHRKILNWEWYQDTNVFRVFIHLLLNANYEDKQWKNIVIKRGQLVTSIKHLSEDLKLSEQQTKTAISKLQITNNITIKTTNKYTLVTIEKYDDYQNKQIENNKQNNKQNILKITNKQQTTQLQHNNKQINNKQYINLINLNKEDELKLFDEGDKFSMFLKNKGLTEDDFNKLPESDQEDLSEEFIMGG